MSVFYVFQDYVLLSCLFLQVSQNFVIETRKRMPSKHLYKLKMSRRAGVIGNKSTHNKIHGENNAKFRKLPVATILLPNQRHIIDLSLGAFLSETSSLMGGGQLLDQIW